jgi:HD domain-containing protein
MNATYRRLKKRCREIVSYFPEPEFYQEFPWAIKQSKAFFETNPIIIELKDIVAAQVDENLGHSIHHAVKVTLDAGTLMVIEGSQRKYTSSFLNRQLLLVQAAGLLHDISRTEKDHAKIGAKRAQKLLTSFTFEPEEISDICGAILNHEAFTKTVHSTNVSSGLISDCLYDADKFRWGPDNFLYTIWDMVESSGTPISKFVKHYPKGMATLFKIRDTFLTKTGKKYGPNFIDTGIAIGNKLYEVMETEFHLL